MSGGKSWAGSLALVCAGNGGDIIEDWDEDDKEDGEGEGIDVDDDDEFDVVGPLDSTRTSNFNILFTGVVEGVVMVMAFLSS